MLLDKEDSCLVLVDVQEKLTPHVMHADKLVARCDWMMRLAQELHVPVLVSEQYPNGLGSTVAALQHGQAPIAKVHFSCWREPRFRDHLKPLSRSQIVLIGIETHVCVLQTALDLLAADFQVFVVVDAVSSRHEEDMKYGLKRIKQAGGWLVTGEMVFFEWVQQAGTMLFKTLSQNFLKK